MSPATGLTLSGLAIAIVVIWVVAKVRHYAKVSERQWEQVDKSKLKDWDDDEWQ